MCRDCHHDFIGEISVFPGGRIPPQDIGIGITGGTDFNSTAGLAEALLLIVAGVDGVRLSPGLKVVGAGLYIGSFSVTTNGTNLFRIAVRVAGNRNSYFFTPAMPIGRLIVKDLFSTGTGIDSLANIRAGGFYRLFFLEVMGVPRLSEGSGRGTGGRRGRRTGGFRRSGGGITSA